MLAAAYSLLATLCVLAMSCPEARAQNCPPSNTMPEFQPFTYTPVVSFNTSAWQSWQYNSPEPDAAPWMRFRMMVPNGFNRCVDDGKKYPLIVFLHGSGESGAVDDVPNNGVGEQDNDKQMVHGGQKHQTAVQNGTFPGFVIYPQIRKVQPPTGGVQNYWGPGNIKAVRYIIDKLIADYKVDPNRIYIHGLSMGGEGAWIFAALYPKYFAAMHPMSAAGSTFWGDSVLIKQIPIRHAQGGLDGAPTKFQGNEMVNRLRAVGANVRYSYYPNGGHSIWNNEYNKSDFFSWFLSNRKNKPWVKFGQTSFCPGANFSVTLGFTPGFDGYEWKKNDTTSAVISTSSQIVVTHVVSASSGVGTYYGRFRRGSQWTAWSQSATVINNTKGPSVTPAITANGSVNLVPLDGSPEVILSGPAAKSQYTWSRVPSGSLPATQSITVNTAGAYSLQTKDAPGTGFESDGETPTEFRAAPEGCLSNPSNPITVTTSNGPGAPATPTNFFASSISPNSVTLAWDDRSSNELAFEIYRSTTPGSSYKLVTITPPKSEASNPQSYVDNVNIQPNTIYYYRMRAVNADGGSAYTPEIAVNTAADNIPPTAPILSLVSASRSEISLSWTASTDAVGIKEYDVYQNGVLIATVPAAIRTYSATGLVAFSTYNYVVRARDLANNASPPSNQIVAAAKNSGLFYTYYHHENDFTSVNNIITNSTVIKTGYVSRFLISPRTQEDMFAFIYEGYINIPTSGSYTFYMQSDAGSTLYVNNVLVVNHDGNHGCNEKTGSTINLSAGSYPIKGLYYEKTGGQCLTVSWKGPGIAKAEIPNSAFIDNVANPPSVAAPSNLARTIVSSSQINLTWTDNSNNETGFEISRSSSSGGTYTVIGVTAANATSFAHTGLAPNSTHYYKIRAINATNASALVGPVNGTTQGVSQPTPPSGLAAVPISATQVNLSWTDNSSNEAGFEIEKSSSNTFAVISSIIVAANATTYSDTQVNGHSTVYYRVRARSAGTNHSGYSNVVQVNTPNRAPTIEDIPNQTLTASSLTPQTLNLSVTDPDSDPITISFTTNGNPGLPSGITFADNGYGVGVLTIVNVSGGPYTIQATGSDGLASASDTFVLTFGSNTAPNVVINTPAGFTNSLTTEEGRTTQLIFTVTDAEGNGTLTNPVTTGGITGLPSFATAQWTGTGTNSRLLTLTFAPGVGQVGIYNMKVDFRDTNNGLTTRNFTVTVLPVDNFFTVSINFAYAVALNANPTYAEASPWNNIGDPSATDIPNLKDDTGTTVRFMTLNTSTLWTVGNAGSPSTYATTFTPDPGTVFTKKVRESFYRRNAGGGTPIVFKNLNPALQYKFKIYGGGTAAGTTSLTEYTVAGAGSMVVNLDNRNNAANTVETGYIFPDASGSITLTTARASGATSGNYYLNGLVMTAQYPSPTPPDAPSGLVLTAPRFDSVRVSWVDNSFNETSFQILRSNTLNGTYTNVGTVAADLTTFVNTPVSGRTTYYYKVRAVNAYGGNESSALVVTTPNGPPSIPNPGTITVRVGETLQQNISATDPENDPVTFATLNLPTFATLVDNGNNSGYIRFIPQNSDIGTYQFTLRATDNFTAQTEIPITVIVLDAELDEAFFVNFKGAGATSDAQAPWNNRSTGDGTPLVNSSGQATSGVSIASSGFTGANTGGVVTGNNSGRYPDNVTQSCWTTASISPGSNLTIQGLNNAKRYNITLFGSKNEFWFANTTYTVNSVAKTLNTTKNKSNVVRFVGIQPTGGSIVINVKKGANVTSLVQRDATINAMVIESYSEGTSPRKPTNLVAEAVSKTEIKLTWEDNSSDETGFEISRATNQAGPFTVIQTTAPNVETFTNGSLTANTGYIYRVRAMKTTGTPSDYTNNALASTYQQIILVSLNYSAAGGHVQAPSPWNNTANVPAEGLTFNNLKNDLNVATTVDLSILTHGSGSGNESGYVPGIYPDNALRNYYFFEQFEAPDQFQLSQLPPNSDFDLVFLGNEWDLATLANIKVATDYIVGTTTLSQFNGRNSTDPVIFRGVKSESDGTISFAVKCNDEARYGVWNTLEIRSYTPLTAIFDTEPPSVPNGLVATDIGEESFQLNWNPSTDNTAVSEYEVFLGSNLIATVTDTFAIISNLQPATTYSVSVRAIDAKLNRSGFSNTLQVTTLNSSQEAVSYYPTPSGDITIAANWGTEVGGTGSHPANFTTARQHFLLNRNATVSSAWTISGTDSRLIVLSGSQLTINSDITGTIDVQGTGIVNVNALNSPSFGTLAPASTVSFTGNPSNVPGANYGNLVLDGNNSNKVFGSGSYTINGDLNVADGISLTGSSGNNTVINILGNLTLAGDANVPSDDQLLTINFVSGATQSLSATQTDLRFNQIYVSGETHLDLLGGTAPKTLTVGSATGGGILLDSGAVLNVGKNRLVIEAAGTVNPLNQEGKIAIKKGDIIVNSTGTQISNLYFEPGSDSVNLIRLNANPAGQVNIRSRMYVDNLVDLANGRLNANDQLVLVSDATHTARIGKVGPTATMIGRIEFQRYLEPKGRAYRYLSAPVYATTVANWSSHLPVTGPFTGSTNANTTNSLFYYDGDNGGWVGYPNATSQEIINLGTGYSIFVFDAVNPKRLRLLGPIQQGSFSFTNLTADFSPETDEADVEAGNGWNLLGNPYASPVRWGTQGWTSSGLNGTVYVKSNRIVNGELVSEVFEWNGTVGDLPKGIIAQGQSFWVKAVDETTPTLTITEDAKYDTLSTIIQREAQPRNLIEVTLRNGSLKDKAYIHFVADATDAFDQSRDAYKLPNSFFNLSSTAGTKSLSINSLSEAFCEKVIPLNVANTKAGQYTFDFAKIESFTYDVDVKLIDHFTGQESDITEGSQYTFDVTSDPASFGANRFALQVKKPSIDQSVVLANNTPEFCGDGSAMLKIQNTQRGATYQILNGTEAARVVIGNGGEVNVAIESTLLQEGVNTFTMKASFEGCVPSVLTSTTAINYVKKPVASIVDNTIVSSYSGTTQWLLDGEPIQGATEAVYEPKVSGEYSVLAIGNNCETTSDPVIFAITGIEQLGENDFVIYPNPVKTRFIVKVPQVKDGADLVLQIYNTLGMVVGEYSGPNRSEGISIDAENLASGLYTIKIAAQRRQLEKRFIRE